MSALYTAKATAIGRIAQDLEKRPPPTAFEIGTRRFGLLIMRLTLLLVLFTILVNAMFHRPLLESFLFGVALAVGLTPELLPMIVSVTLSRGALRMARRQVIVKRLSAIQDMGAMDVLCTDKTGTLTEARIRLEQHLDPAGNDSARVLRLAFLTDNRWHPVQLPGMQAVRCTRFLDRENLAGYRARLRFNERAAAELLEQATALMAQAKSCHDELETYYRTTVDFAQVDEAAARCAELFGLEAPSPDC